MRREDLSELLAQHYSLEEIGRRVGLSASTVGYWLRHHGLQATGAKRHAARGGLPRELLEQLISRDLSVREIALEVERSVGTVRYWLGRYQLKTSARARRAGPKLERRVMDCIHHGRSEFAVPRTGSPRCLTCRRDAVVERRRRAKLVLIAEAGGQCILCGYARCPSALHFHHLDPREKRFGIAGRGLAHSLDNLRIEAEKCVLLCSNCHAEVESGYQVLDLQWPSDGFGLSRAADPG